eukprot:TRINITY_DN4984_c0_g1_i1.p1 TRINITY_DN4984_c0_g1~~TRINITY_DN4984_c0_g1_i1.p1  ORF type:complete len:176 (+),score=60.55 TRINITY_DN4984_c0_g1_i1:50-529(+)
MSSIATKRLVAERKAWRKNKPFGFFARPQKNNDGSINMLTWNCGIPGKADTDWEGGLYPVVCYFSEEYPSKPPKCCFPSGFFHPNVYPSGTICLSILNEDEDWKPAITLKQILLGVQDLLDTPNPDSPAQREAYQSFVTNKSFYSEKILEQARKYNEDS